MKFTFRVHAIQRMFERRISQESVEHIGNQGEVIAAYENDKPYPSKLILGSTEGRPLHVVVAYNKIDDERIIVIVYEPDPILWESDFRRKKK